MTHFVPTGSVIKPVIKYMNVSCGEKQPEKLLTYMKKGIAFSNKIITQTSIHSLQPLL